MMFPFSACIMDITHPAHQLAHSMLCEQSTSPKAPLPLQSDSEMQKTKLCPKCISGASIQCQA